MDFKPIPPSGQVEDLRKTASAPTQEEIEAEKQAKREKTRRNLRIIALCLAAYYFGSAIYSWYEESQHEANAVAEVNINNPLKDPQAFRDAFNALINAADTSLPIATANDSQDGFVAVLSTALEIQGHVKPQSKELQEVQIQTRYPDAFPPESILAFRSFVLACEQLANPAFTQEQADQLLSQAGLVPQVDANEDNKVFPNSTFRSNTYEYRTTFTSGPIDELTLIAVPLANLNSAASDAPLVDVTSDVPVIDGSSDVPAVEGSSDVPTVNVETAPASAYDSTATESAYNSTAPESNAVDTSSNSEDVPAL